MKKRAVSIPAWLGLGLILCSLCVLLYSWVRTQSGQRKCQRALVQMEALLPERTPGVPEQAGQQSMPVLQIHGEDYVALLQIPAWDLSLPVADPWNSHKLHAGPRRFYGSAQNGTLVIGGIDREMQFAFCAQIQHGDRILITDMTGATFAYTVTRIDRAKHAETQWLVQEGIDLTLFCRDRYAREYVAVRCVISLT